MIRDILFDLLQMTREERSVFARVFSFLSATSVPPFIMVNGVFSSWDTSMLN